MLTLSSGQQIDEPTMSGESNPDASVSGLMKVIKTLEGGDYNNRSGDGGASAGAYQWNNDGKPLKPGELPSHWKNAAAQFLKDPNAPMTPANQDYVAYQQIKSYKDQGRTPTEIDALWNGASKDKTTGLYKHNSPQREQAFLQTSQKLQQTPQDVSQETQGTTDTYGASFPASQTDTPLTAGLKAVGNVPSSLFNLAGGLFSAVTHPIKTVEGIGNAFAGGIEEGWNKLTGGQSSDVHTQTFDALKKALYDRYGSLENAQRSATNDPVGVGSDILAILEGGATLADKALGTTGIDIAKNAAETSARTFGQTGLNVMPKVGEGQISGTLNRGLTSIAQPIVGTIKSTMGILPKLAGQTLGLETGVGYDPIRQGLQASTEGGDAMKAFTQALRGNTTPEELVNQARSALGDVINTRNQNYRNMISGLKTDTTTFDISPIVRQVEQKLKDFGITKNADGTLNFSRSAIGEGSDATKIENIYNDIKNWGNQPGDRTAIGIDTLKRRIGNYYSPNSDIRAFITGVKQSTKNVLENAPGYTTGMKNYAEMSDSISEIQKALSLGDNASVETSFKKLTSALKNNEFRKQVILGLDQDTGGQLLSKIAGQRLSSIMPRGLAGVLEGGIGATTAILHPGGILPLLGLAITTSPRIVGEFVRALGLGLQGTNKLMTLLNKFATPAVMTGNINNRFNRGGLQ